MQTAPMLYTLATSDRELLMDCYDNIIKTHNGDMDIEDRNVRAAEKVMNLFHMSLQSPDKNSIQIELSFIDEIIADIHEFEREAIFVDETNAMKAVVGKLLSPQVGQLAQERHVLGEERSVLGAKAD